MPVTRRRHRPISVPAVTASVAALLLGGCFGEPEGPDSAAGTRVVGEELEYWLGGECSNVTAIDVDLRDEKRATLDRWSVTATGGVAATVETFTAGVGPAGFSETDPLEVDVSEADIAIATISRTDGGDPVEVVAQVADLVADPAPHDNAWRLVYRGWTADDDVRDLIGEGELAPACD